MGLEQRFELIHIFLACLSSPMARWTLKHCLHTAVIPLVKTNDCMNPFQCAVSVGMEED